MSKFALPNLVEVTVAAFDDAKAKRQAARARIETELGKDLPCVTALLKGLTVMPSRAKDAAFNVFQPSFTQNVPGIVIDAENGSRLIVNRAYNADGTSIPDTYAIHTLGGEQKYALAEAESENRMLIKITQWAAAQYPADMKSDFQDRISQLYRVMQSARDASEAVANLQAARPA